MRLDRRDEVLFVPESSSRIFHPLDLGMEEDSLVAFLILPSLKAGDSSRLTATLTGSTKIAGYRQTYILSAVV